MFVAVNLRRRRKNQLESGLLLNFQNVPRTDNIRRPQRVVILLAVDPAKLGRQVINVVVLLLERPFELAKRRDVGPKVFLIGLMLKIEAPDIVSALSVLVLEVGRAFP